MKSIVKVCIAAFAVMALGTIMVGSASAQTIMKLNHSDLAGGNRDKAGKKFAEKVEEYTKGRYIVRVYPASQLGTDQKALDQMQLGGIEFAISGPAVMSVKLPILDLTMMPYLVDTYQQGWKLFDESPWIKAQFDKLPAKGLRVLSMLEAGFRELTTKEPVQTPADAKGRKLRTFESEMMRWTLDAMGFTAQILPIPEVYLGIQQGVVFGQENPIDTIYANKFYEVAPYVTMTNHIYGPLLIAASEKAWQSIPEADRPLFIKAAQDATAFSRAEVIKDIDIQIAEMKAKGAIFATPDAKPWREAMKVVYDKARAKYGADVDAILADAEAVRKAYPAK
jgi:tripartite ATP-independent transporter DctP family solute receptor